MSPRRVFRIAGAALALVLLPAALPAAAQAPRQEAAKPAPRLPNGTPDLSGVWMGGGGVAERNLKPGDAIVLLPEAKKIVGRPACRA
jgi:hypothetical protein